MMTDGQMIEVLRAHKEGKKIQQMSKINSPLVDSGWQDCGETILWNFYANLYRVAPEPSEPREFLLCDGTDHERWIVVNENHVNDELCKGERVRVREVLE